MKFSMILIVLTAVTAAYGSYHGYKVYHVLPQSENQMNLLKIFHNENFDYWSHPEIGVPFDVMVAPKSQQLFTRVLELNNIEYSILINDVEESVQLEKLLQSSAPKVPSGQISFTKYHRYSVMQEYLQRLANDYPDIVSLEDIGYSFEGRPLTVMKIGRGGNDKPIIFVEAGIHAREWISPALALYVIYQLVENEANRGLIENIDWYVIPTMNPDGYEYTHTDERMWRKTRTPGVKCYGVDANRNFDIQWMKEGSSDDECSNMYAGPKPFSERETSAIRDAVLKYKHNIKLYLAIHSYGQYVLYSWGWTPDLPNNSNELNELGTDAANAIKAVNGTQYKVGTWWEVLYPSSGTSQDWTRDTAGINLSYTIELPAGGSEGFDLPPERIIGVCKETWDAFIVFQKYIDAKYVGKIN